MMLTIKKVCIAAGIIFLLIIFPNCSSTEKIVTTLPYDPPGATITTNKMIFPQHYRTISFSRVGLSVSNEFEGSRLNDFYQVDETTFVAEIKPENAPINNSAWYAFKLWANEEKEIILKLKYTDGTHRYKPKLSKDGNKWELLDTTLITVDSTGEIASLKLKLSTDTLWISAQELITSKYFEKWIDEYSNLLNAEKKILGHSSQKKPIYKLQLNSTETSDKYVVVIGRLHPPEVTGSLALMTFVNTVSGESVLAANFRERFNLVAIPLVNPDGVDNGHWRHNANGIDINRDWFYFNQPEPLLVKNEIERIIKEENGEIKFFIDFHSTTEDVFYNMSVEALKTADLPEEDFQKQKEGLELINLWLNNLQSSMPDYHVNIVDTLSKPTSPTSDRWLQREFNVPAITYEVADTTSRNLIMKVASSAAEELMKLLIERESHKN